jgi:LPS sulfotransferase NodH
MHVRMKGAGPEATGSEATGSNVLFRHLALTGYQGSISLVPSGRERLEEWEDWLLNRRDWGCNTAADKRAQRAS